MSCNHGNAKKMLHYHSPYQSVFFITVIRKRTYEILEPTPDKTIQTKDCVYIPGFRVKEVHR